ncbi:MAG: division/cell wall cluster transcriptional repressor MraZ [Candidatus Niyogibacteria bacterium]|nr:division/cell wall cluster transcriptional repressor MraZ [Candidatus Niyogibacteria bacterium]
MLIGEYEHTIDAKKRMALPAKFRKDLGREVVVTRGLDRCLFAYPMSEWQKVSEALASLPTGQASNRSFVRLFLAGAAHTEMDALGRILIPEYLKQYAELSEKVAVVGVGKRLEIWDWKRWEMYKAETEKQADTLAERLGEIGAY